MKIGNQNSETKDNQKMTQPVNYIHYESFYEKLDKTQPDILFSYSALNGNEVKSIVVIEKQ